MFKMSRTSALVLVMLLPFFASGCLQEKLPPGVVAVVNGERITLREVEALQDVSGAGLPMGTEGSGSVAEVGGTASAQLQPGEQDQAVALLREKYGETLAVLICWKLIRQTLVQEELAVPDEKEAREKMDREELAQAEAAVRADYPHGEFEKTLQEEFIDLETWREFLALRLAVQRFQEKILRPQIKIDAAEVAAWYKAHEADFNFPAKVKVAVYAGVSKEQMETVRKQLLAGETPPADALLTRQTLQVPLERLAPQQRNDLKDVGPGKPTAVRETEDGLFQVLLQEEIIPARTMNVVQAYGLVEQALVEEKMEPVFQKWLHKALASARIEVASALLPVPSKSREGR